MEWIEDQSTIKKINDDWERFIASGVTDGLTVRSEVLESWKRSYNAGADPAMKGTKIVLNHESLMQERLFNNDLIKAAKPVMEQLGRIVDGSRQLLLLCNADAVILDVYGDRMARKNADIFNMRPGGGLNEAIHGTNSFGTALALRRPVTIFAAEHYIESAKAWDCVAAPIMRANNGDIVGILGITSHHKILSKQNINTVFSATQAIEVRLMEMFIRRRDALLMAYAENVLRHGANLVVALDTDGHVAISSSGEHPLLINKKRHFQVIPKLKQGIRNILSDPLIANIQVDSIQLPDGRKYTVTYSAVYNRDCLCGILMYAYGNKPFSGQRVSVVNDKANTLVLEKHKKIQAGPFCNLVGASPVFKRVLEQAARVAANNATVVLIGETGVGKEGFARAIHQSSPRAKGPFIAVNSGAIPKDLIASELFGYMPGAFTGALSCGNTGKFEAANGGTVFLDEIGELSAEAQTSLLRVLQEKEVVRLGGHVTVPVDVRVIAATNNDLRQLVRQGLFREDLYYRLCVVEISIPPLRERPEDFPHLIAYFLASYGIHGVTLKKKTLRHLAAYHWPGNVRELMNVIQRAVALGQDVEETLVDYVYKHTEDSALINRQEEETDPIACALNKTGGNIAQAARELGVARSTIYRHLREMKGHLNRSLKFQKK